MGGLEYYLGDLDEFFGYRTVKHVLVRDRFLGLLDLAFKLAVFVYLCITVVVDQAYLAIEAPTGTVRLTVEMPPIQELPRAFNYCTNSPGVPGPVRPQVPGEFMNCAFWDTSEVQLPGTLGEIFIPTRATIHQLNYSCGDDDYTCRVASARDGVYPPREELFRGFVYGIDMATVFIDHTVEGNGEFKIQRKVGEMNGRLLDCGGRTVREFKKAVPGLTREENIVSRLITVQELIQYAKVGTSCGPLYLDMPSMNDPQRPLNTLRYDGLFLNIVIDYDNTKGGVAGLADVEYTMKITGFTKADPSYVTLDGEGVGIRRRVNRHGIAIGVTQTGTLGDFSLRALVLNLTAGLGLLAVSATITSLLAMYVMPLREEYTAAMIEKTQDFGEYREAMSDEDEAAHPLKSAECPSPTRA